MDRANTENHVYEQTPNSICTLGTWNMSNTYTRKVDLLLLIRVSKLPGRASLLSYP